jgi:hypothetical protein
MQLLWEESMPRYFFHIASGRHVHKDDVGQEFPSPNAALKEARLLAGELLRDAAFARRLNLLLYAAKVIYLTMSRYCTTWTARHWS